MNPSLNEDRTLSTIHDLIRAVQEGISVAPRYITLLIEGFDVIVIRMVKGHISKGGIIGVYGLSENGQ
jgi:hypothetical protein